MSDKYWFNHKYLMIMSQETKDCVVDRKGPYSLTESQIPSREHFEGGFKLCTKDEIIASLLCAHTAIMQTFDTGSDKERRVNAVWSVTEDNRAKVLEFLESCKLD